MIKMGLFFMYFEVFIFTLNCKNNIIIIWENVPIGKAIIIIQLNAYILRAWTFILLMWFIN